MVIVFMLITTEVIHRTMAAMIGATMALYFLALQNRVPSLTTVVSWMDHGTLGLLWGMMLIVGITMRTGVFEWLGVLACRLSGGNKWRLCLLMSIVTGVLSAFLDNVTTILRKPPFPRPWRKLSFRIPHKETPQPTAPVPSSISTT